MYPFDMQLPYSPISIHGSWPTRQDTESLSCPNVLNPHLWQAFPGRIFPIPSFYHAGLWGGGRGVITKIVLYHYVPLYLLKFFSAVSLSSLWGALCSLLFSLSQTATVQYWLHCRVDNNSFFTTSLGTDLLPSSVVLSTESLCFLSAFAVRDRFTN